MVSFFFGTLWDVCILPPEETKENYEKHRIIQKESYNTEENAEIHFITNLEAEFYDELNNKKN